MSIEYNEQEQMFHLRAGASSYILQVVKNGYLVHRYFGPALSRSVLVQPLVMLERAFSPNPDPADESLSLDTLPQEYPTYGLSDFRTPALSVRAAHSGDTIDLRYTGHRILQGKPALSGLPATYVEADDEATTLEIDMRDSLSGVCVCLRYTAFSQYAVIARSVTVANEGTKPVQLEGVMSLSLDMRDASFDWMHLEGAWGRERHVVREPLTPGAHVVESRRGASSHQANPFVMLARPEATETSGEVYGLSLVYSGNFEMRASVDQYRTTRLLAGIHPEGFSWRLEPGQTFTTPEALLSFSDQGLGGLSRLLHRLIRTRLVRGEYRDRERPVLINNWEATYFRFERETLVELAGSAAELGVELFVLDDGWFGRRDNDRSSLGDWVVDERKLPQGLGDIAQAINRKGMQFGLWFEPEMISPDSELYRMHPDWCLHIPGRQRSEGRHQLVLDLTRADVREYVVETLCTVLASAPIGYVKWDMNRHMTEVGSALLPADRQGETAHRYMLGLYAIMDVITGRFPAILFESCSGGGGRFDLGMLYYMPQVWTSDNTDAVERLAIQFGTSLGYPSAAMGAHVSAVPNHQVGRNTPIQTRGLVAMMGNFGYELDVRKLPLAEREEIALQIRLYKEVRPLVLFGDLYRLRDPQAGNNAAWMYVKEDQTEAFVTFVRVLSRPNAPLETLRLQGLLPDRLYDVQLHGGYHRELFPSSIRQCTVSGDELMAAGLVVAPMHGDYQACAWRLRAQD
ncbi:MAG: alpha-galactosidase [Firmicutes bacterium]|nr:alpha-galactosidase [Bacillota bacterium]